MLSAVLGAVSLSVTLLSRLVACACVPDYPDRLLADPAVLEHPSVIAAWEAVHRNLSALYVNTTRDGLSVAVAHSSRASPVYTFNHGALKHNETSLYASTANAVTSDSIFRVVSVSKNLAVSSALVVETLLKKDARGDSHRFTLDTPVRSLLPAFRLPAKDWDDGGSEITLRMLASHTAGITRESYSTGFNMVLSTGKANAATIGAEWAGASAQEVIDGLATTNLMFAPGQRAAYSNAGTALLGSAVVTHYNHVTGASLSWSELVTRTILERLNMTHSFFGVIPRPLIPEISIPGGENWADLIVGAGYDPAAGMWSSSSDLVAYLHHLWLRPEPSLITRFQRRQLLKPDYALQDGKQQVGAGWEIQLLALSSRSNTSTASSEKTYSIFGKSGDGGGWHSWIDVMPHLGYGLVILSQQSALANYTSISPTRIRDTVHDILAPAFADALAARMADRFSGNYTDAQDTGLTVDRVATPAPYTPTYARVEVEDRMLYLRELVINGTSALEAVDRLSWTANDGPRYFSTPQGVVLESAEGAGETAQFGAGARVWRMMLPGLASCDWFDFDGYKDTRGWPLSKLVLVEREGEVELHYPPFDIVMTRPRK